MRDGEATRISSLRCEDFIRQWRISFAKGKFHCGTAAQLKLPYGLYRSAVIVVTNLTEGEEAVGIHKADAGARGKVEGDFFQIYLKTRVGEARIKGRECDRLKIAEDILHGEDACLPLAFGHILKLGKCMCMGKSEAGCRGATESLHTSATAEARADIGTEGADIGALRASDIKGIFTVIDFICGEAVDCNLPRLALDGDALSGKVAELFSADLQG